MSLVINSTTLNIFESLLTNLINRWTNIEKRREIIRPHRPAKTNTKAVEMLRSIIDSLILLFDNTSLRRGTNGDKVSSYHKGTTIIYCAREGGGGGAGAGGVEGWISIPDTPSVPPENQVFPPKLLPPLPPQPVINMDRSEMTDETFTREYRQFIFSWHSSIIITTLNKHILYHSFRTINRSLMRFLYWNSSQHA